MINAGVQKYLHGKELEGALEERGKTTGEGFTFTVVRLLWSWYDIPGDDPLKKLYWTVMEEMAQNEQWIKDEAQSFVDLYADDLEEAKHQISFYVLQVKLLRRGIELERDVLDELGKNLGAEREIFLGILQDFRRALAGKISFSLLKMLGNLPE